MLIVYFVYINLDDITRNLKALIISKSDLVIKEPNSYKVDYPFENFNYKISYVPYNKEELSDGETREYMKFHPAIAPYKVAILPLMKKYHTEKAKELFNLLNKEFMVSYDESGSIGKRYRRQDMMGTPFAVTVDDNTLNNGTVTIRDRDTMEQITLKVEEIANYINQKIKL